MQVAGHAPLEDALDDDARAQEHERSPSAFGLGGSSARLRGARDDSTSRTADERQMPAPEQHPCASNRTRVSFRRSRTRSGPQPAERTDRVEIARTDRWRRERSGPAEMENPLQKSLPAVT